MESTTNTNEGSAFAGVLPDANEYSANSTKRKDQPSLLPVAVLDSAVSSAVCRYMAATLTAIKAVEADPTAAPAYREALRDLRMFFREVERAAVIARRNSILGFVFESSREVV